QGENTRLSGAATSGDAQAAAAAQRASALAASLDKEKALSGEALARVDLLNQQLLALRRQIAALNSALEASEKRDQDSQDRIKDLGVRLNAALARQVRELKRYRSDFFGRLGQLLKNRKDIRIVGDRFVFQSEVLFPSGSADMSVNGLAAMDELAKAILELAKAIPGEIDWALQVDGHTDARPINSPQFPSNWELSTSRAISVVRYLASRGVPPNRLVAAGYGEFQPLDRGTSEEALTRNRRIELKLTNR
ncbi:MAG TPA: peptidoglycan -binding protein, partial [Hyphomicrobiaceae bacterium]|nr:peptidoglycan -binding protein [Hyphomicrobiaceae bacterium]